MTPLTCDGRCIDATAGRMGRLPRPILRGYAANPIAAEGPRGEGRSSFAVSSISGRLDQARTDETLQPARIGAQPRPVVEGKIDDDEAGRRQFFVDAFARFDVA